MTKNFKKRLGIYAMAGAGALILVGLSVAAALSPYEHVDQRHCVVGAVPAKVLAVELDTSDPLVVVEPREVSFAIDQSLNSLNKGDRIIALDVGGKALPEIAPIVDQCHPGDDDNIARNAFRRTILQPIAAHLRDVLGRPAAAESPLAESMVSLASDPSIHPRGSKLVILFVTDGMQNSALESAYRRGSKFPKPEGQPLKGVVIELVLIKNERDIALQPRAIVRLTAWLQAAGAQVIAPEPGWLSLARTEHRGGKR